MAPAAAKGSQRVGRGSQALSASAPEQPARQQLGAEQQLAAVDGVGGGAAEEGGEQQRHQLHRAEQPDREGRAGELEDLEGDGDVGDHAADQGHELPDVEGAVVAMAAQRSDVDQHGGQKVPSGTPATAAIRQKPAGERLQSGA